MDIMFTAHAREDFTFWLETDSEQANKIKALVASIKQNPFKGLGKPEPLKHDLKGYLSRCITFEHRLVYKVSGKRGVGQKCTVVQCRFHYDD